MKYIFGNFVDLERTISYLESNDVDYTYEDGRMCIKEGIEKIAMKVIFNYIDFVAIYYEVSEEDEEEGGDDYDYELDVENEFYQDGPYEVVIVETEICSRDIVEGNYEEIDVVLKPTEIRPGMILSKSCINSGEKYYIPMSLDEECTQWMMYEICENQNVGAALLDYNPENDMVFFNGELNDGVVDLREYVLEDSFTNYEFVGYLKVEFFYKMILNISGHERYYSDDIIEEYPYHFVSHVEMFSRAYPQIPKIRFYSENKLDAIRAFLKKLYFYNTNRKIELILALAISSGNNDILDLIKMIKYSYPGMKEQNILEEVLDAYHEFLINNFNEHKNLLYIPVNDFIKFVINSY